MNKLTPEQQQELLNSPHFKLGIMNGVNFALLKAEEAGVKLPTVVQAYEHDFGEYPNRDKHMGITGSPTPPPTETEEKALKTKEKRAGKETKSEQK